MPAAPRRRRLSTHIALASILIALLPVFVPAAQSRHIAAPVALAIDKGTGATPVIRRDPDAPSPRRDPDAGTASRDGSSAALADSGPAAAEAWFIRQRAYPLSAIPTGARLRALNQTTTLRQVRATARGALRPDGAPNTTPVWQHVGDNAQQTNGSSRDNNGNPLVTNYGAVGGRVTSLVADPTNAATLYAGTAGGGVWKTTDGGQNWTPATDAQPSLAIGAMAIAPTAPYTVYAATGEGNFSADSYYGAGILESANGGQTWAQTGTSLNKLSASRLIVDPRTPSILYVAAGQDALSKGATSASGGIYRSTDGGATWSLSLDPATQSSAPGCAHTGSSAVPGTDLAAGTNGVTTTVYAALGDVLDCATNGVYRSTDNGQTWTRLAGFDAAVPSADWPHVGRIAVATMPNNPQVVYAAVECVNLSYPYTCDGQLEGVYESIDGGATWTQLPHPNDTAYNNQSASQYWYDMYVAVDPAISSTVYLGGIDVFKSTNLGATWTNLTNAYSTGNVHPDQHALHVGAGGSLYAGDDGGVYYSGDGGTTWSDRDGGLEAIQLYGASVSASGQPLVLYGGSQDNDVAQSTGGQWTSVIGGDGVYSVIDPTDSNIAYAEVQDGRLYRTTDGGATWTQITAIGNDPGNDGAPFITALAMDPSNPHRLLMGTYRLWESTDQGTTWHTTGTGQDLTDGSVNGDTINALVIAPGAPNTIYAGTTNGHIQATSDDGVTWTDGSGVPNRYVTGIAVSPVNAATAWAALSGFNGATPTTHGHVFQTTDGGATWHDVSGDLPDVPVNSLVVDARGTLVAGTDTGVFISTNNGTNWTPLGSGLPDVPVFQLILRGDGTLYAATHGRGLWSLYVGLIPLAPTSPPTATPVPPTSTPVPPTSTPVPPSNTPVPPTSTPVPPTSTPAPPTATATNTATATVTPAATGTPPLITEARNTPAPLETARPIPTGVSRPVPPVHHHAAPALLVAVPHNRVVSRGTVAVTFHTAPRTPATITLRLTDTTQVWVRRGKHHRRVTHTTVVQNVTIHTRSDRHGVIRAPVRITYAPRRATTVALTVTVRTRHGSTTHSVRITVEPPPPHRKTRRHTTRHH